MRFWDVRRTVLRQVRLAGGRHDPDKPRTTRGSENETHILPSFENRVRSRCEGSSTAQGLPRSLSLLSPVITCEFKWTATVPREPRPHLSWTSVRPSSPSNQRRLSMRTLVNESHPNERLQHFHPTSCAVHSALTAPKDDVTFPLYMLQAQCQITGSSQRILTGSDGGF